MNKSESIKELAKALAEVQATIGGVEFDSTANAGRFSYRYASLGAHIELAKALPKHGLAYAQFPISDNWYAGVETILMHESGEWISEKVLFPYNGDLQTPDGKMNNPAQEAGKVITYARRYALAAMLGIYSEEDVDAGIPIKKEDKPRTRRPEASGKRPYKPEELKKRLLEVSKTQIPASVDQMSLLASMLSKVLEDKEMRHDAQEYLFGARSLTKVNKKLINAGLKWLDIDENFNVNELAEKELKAVQNAFLISKGQQKMDKILDELQV